MAWFKENSKQPSIDRRRSLASIPMINPGVRLETEEDGRLLVLVPLRPRRRSWFLRLQPGLTEHRLRLDELGAFVVGQIDGERSVGSIVTAFVKRYGVTYREAELSTAEFIRSLAQRQVISIGVR